VHFDKDGEISYLVNGESVRLYIVDERAPGDRVYEWLPRSTVAEIVAAIPVGEVIGNSMDERHPVLTHRIEAAMHGMAHLEIIP
jgi:hypothetical protein